MTGTLALVGSGEFLATMCPIDALLLARTSSSSPPRVTIIPTASAPDGPAVMARWADQGRAHFAALGARVDAALIATRADADDPSIAQNIATSDIVYLSGGKPGFLLETLQDTRAWDAALHVYTRGGVLAGCSAGAMILGAKLLAPRLRLGWPWVFKDALNLIDNTLILPHYDALPSPLSAIVRRSLPRSLTLLGIDEHTALISDGDEWLVLGRSGVEITHAQQPRRYCVGDRLRIG